MRGDPEAPPEGPGQAERDPVGLPERAEVARVRPASGDEAGVLVEADVAGASVINYHFPVQIEVIGELDEAQMKAVADYVLDQLNAELGRRG